MDWLFGQNLFVELVWDTEIDSFHAHETWWNVDDYTVFHGQQLIFNSLIGLK